VLRDRGADRVAVIDIDAHHGNGTQEIFWSRADVLYGSVHVDPGAGWFPHFVGFADETGAGEGVDCTLNVPLAEGTADASWLAGIKRLAQWVTAAECAALVVSLGVDAAVDDPESPLQITTAGYAAAGGLLGALGLPTVLVQEGGYHLPTLGDLVAVHLRGYV
jgi:acetoin utilization deacetylase AcuC-like enzyme